MSSKTFRNPRSRNLSKAGKVGVGVAIGVGALAVLAVVGSGVVLYRMMRM